MAVFTASLAGYAGRLTSGGHTGEAFTHEGVEAFAAIGVLVDVLRRRVASLRPGLHVLSFKPPS